MKMKEAKAKREKGITLVALIITIIILIILAAITIKSATDFDIVKVGIKGTENYAKAQVDEEKEFENIEGMVSSTIDKINDLQNGGGNNNNDSSENNSEELEKLRLKYKEIEDEFNKYKKNIVEAINNNGVNANIKDAKETINDKINRLTGINYSDGTSSTYMKVSENLNSRYNQQIDCTSILNYKKLSPEHFIIINKQMTWTNTSDGNDILTMTKDYNKETGILTLGRQKSYANDYTFCNIYDVYVFANNNNNTFDSAQNVENSVNIESYNLQQLKTKLEELQNEYNRYKELVTDALKKNNIDSKVENEAQKSVENINNMSKKYFFDGLSTKFIKVAGDISTRYNQTIDFTGVTDYKNITLENIIMVNKSMDYANYSDKADILVMSKGYDQQTGSLSLGMQKSYSSANNNPWTFWNILDIYVLK